MPPDAPLTREAIVAAAKDVIRRFGPSKATVVDVARALGVSHTAIYQHVASKAELRDLVISQWLETSLPPLRAIVAKPGPAPLKLRELVDAMIAFKRSHATEDPELFSAYRILAADAKSVIGAYVEDVISLIATVIASGIEDATFREVSPLATGRAVLIAISKFHHPAHAVEWSDPALDDMFNDVWGLIMNGLSRI